MKITKEYLIQDNWCQNYDLYYHKNDIEYDYYDDILWIPGKKGIWNIDTVEKLENEIRKYKIEIRSKKIEKIINYE